jgi:hypothetical protein
MTPILYEAVVVGVMTIPATAPNIPDNAKLITTILLTLMPMRLAARGLTAHARIPLPVMVFSKKK